LDLRGLYIFAFDVSDLGDGREFCLLGIDVPDGDLSR
jgi:hypothetical protein